MLKKTIACLAALSLSVFALVPAKTASAAGKGGIKPQYQACDAGWVFEDISQVQSLQFYDRVDGTHYVNETQNPITFTFTCTGTHTISATVSSEIKGGWGPIELKLGGSVSGFLSWTSTESVQAIVQPHYEGWNQYGVSRSSWEQ